MKNWSLSRQIWSILGLLVIAFVGSQAYSVHSVSELKERIDDVTGHVVKRKDLGGDLLDEQRQMAIAAMEVILEHRSERAQALAKKSSELEERHRQTVKQYREIETAENEAILHDYEEQFTKWIAVVRKAEVHALAGNDAAAWAELTTADDLRKTLREDLKKLNDQNDKVLAAETDAANALAARTLWLIFLIGSVSITCTVTIAYLVLKSLTRGVRNVVATLSDSSAQVHSAAGQIAAAAEQLSHASTEQAASLEETAAAIEELNSTVAKTSTNASDASEKSGGSRDKAEFGRTVVNEMIQSMAEIRTSNQGIAAQIDESNRKIGEIVKVITDINTKTKVINDIVFQTKLLSFNASVEAARAGESGKGFAVVAEEVGKLAQMSGNAAKEITEMLDGSVKRVELIVSENRSKVEKLVSSGVATVDSGTKVAERCGQVLVEIVANADIVSRLAQEIASASGEQARGVAEITKAMSQLDQATQENSAATHEAASSAEELSAQAMALNEAVGFLRGIVEGRAAVAAVAGAEVYQLPTSRERAALKKSA